jgi:pyruvate formate lyase activating enzyme
MAVEGGLVFNIQRFSLRDGPGIRSTVFLKGCPLECAWCHNPESRDSTPELEHFEERCTQCHACLAACTCGLTDPARRPAECRLCGACVEACPADARRLSGRRMTVEEVLDEVERDRVFYDESGGGVTLSGGEPLVQQEFTSALLVELRARGLRTALDTCGHVPREALLAAPAELFLYDVKLIDAERHRAFTGVDNGLILANLAALATAGRTVVVRYPLIPGVNDTGTDLDALAGVLAPLALRRVDLLPYHDTAQAKYRRLGRKYALAGTPRPAEEAIAQAAARLRENGLEVTVGG